MRLLVIGGLLLLGGLGYAQAHIEARQRQALLDKNTTLEPAGGAPEPVQQSEPPPLCGGSPQPLKKLPPPQPLRKKPPHSPSTLLQKDNSNPPLKKLPLPRPLRKKPPHSLGNPLRKDNSSLPLKKSPNPNKPQNLIRL
jgi:hypothetical protein